MTTSLLNSASSKRRSCAKTFSTQMANPKKLMRNVRKKREQSSRGRLRSVKIMREMR